MASLDHLIKVNNILKLSGLRAVGFNKTLVITGDPGGVFGPELTRTYDGPTSLALDWGAATAARRRGDVLFGQELQPSSARVGRLTDAPALRLELILGQVLNSTVYSLRVLDENGAWLEASITSSAADNDTIVGQLVTEIDGLGVANLTVTAQGSVGSQYVRLQWAAGYYGAVSLKDAAGLDFGPHNKDLLRLRADTQAPSGTTIATQLDNIKLEANDWFYLINPYPGKALSEAIASWCDTNKKWLIQADPTSAMALDAEGSATDLMKSLKTAARKNCEIIYHPEMDQGADAALAGGTPPTPGTWTHAFRTLTGVDAVNLTDTQRQNILNKNGNAYYDVGAPILFEGMAPDGTYADARITGYELESALQVASFNLKKSAQPTKVPGNDLGIQMERGAMVTVFNERTGPGRAFEIFTIVMPAQADRSASDKAARKLSGIEYKAVYQSAIHKVEMSGFIEQ